MIRQSSGCAAIFKFPELLNEADSCPLSYSFPFLCSKCICSREVPRDSSCWLPVILLAWIALASAPYHYLFQLASQQPLPQLQLLVNSQYPGNNPLLTSSHLASIVHHEMHLREGIKTGNSTTTLWKLPETSGVQITVSQLLENHC